MEQKVRQFIKWGLRPAVIFVIGGSFWIAYRVMFSIMNALLTNTITDIVVAIVCWSTAIWIVCGVWREQK